MQPIETHQTVPSRWHYLVAAAFGVAGLSAFIIVLVTQVLGNLPDIQIVVPGTHEIHLKEPGTYTVFYEHRSEVDGRTFSTGENLPGMTVSIRPKAGFSRIEVSTPFGSSEYSFGGRAGVSVLEFTVENPGTYIVSADYDGSNGPDVVLAIGQLNILASLGIGLGSLFGGVIIGAVIAIRALIKRRKPH